MKRELMVAAGFLVASVASIALASGAPSRVPANGRHADSGNTIVIQASLDTNANAELLVGRMGKQAG